MDEFNNASVVSGTVNAAGGLILKTRGGSSIDAGNVKGPIGNTGPAGATGIAGGTTTTRNATFPLPTSVSTAVALANKVITWFNTSTGVFETYYATNGSTGLTVPGVPGAYGWYENLYLASLPKGEVAMKFTQASTGNIDSAVSGWVQTDFVEADLIAGRKYRLKYKITHGSNAANMALAAESHVQLATEANSVRSGTLYDDAVTFYVAPAPNQGKTDVLEWYYSPATSAKYRFKVAILRSTLNGTFQLERRRLSVLDEGI